MCDERENENRLRVKPASALENAETGKIKVSISVCIQIQNTHVVVKPIRRIGGGVARGDSDLIYILLRYIL